MHITILPNAFTQHRVGWCSGPRLATPIEKIHKQGLDAEVEERATALFETLVALASAQTLSSIDEGEKAMRILGCLLRGETGASGASAS